ncbi:MAG: DoxX family protein [Planctomycetota bacterium]
MTTNAAAAPSAADISVSESNTQSRPTGLSLPAKVGTWLAQIGAAAILGQTLFFKFTGAPETVALFNTVGLGDAGRFGTAALELVAVVLLLIPRTAWAGALVALGVISGAIMSHFTKLGISIDAAALNEPALEPLNGPSLFVMAVVVFVASAVVLVIRRGQLPVIGAKLTASDRG